MTSDQTSHDSTTTKIIHGVFGAHVKVIAMIRIQRGAIPQAIRQSHMRIVDTRIDDSHNDTVTGVIQVFPDLIRMDVRDTPLSDDGTVDFSFLPCKGHGLNFIIQINQRNISSLSKSVDDLGSSLATDTVKNPIRVNVTHTFTSIVKELDKPFLAILRKITQLLDSQGSAKVVA